MLIQSKKHEDQHVYKIQPTDKIIHRMILNA